MFKKINIHITKTRSVRKYDLDSCVKLLNKAVTIKASRININPIELNEYFDWNDCFKKLDFIRQNLSIDDDDFLVILTEKSNSDNWFSAFSQKIDNKNIFVQTSDWQNYIYTKDIYPISYEIIANVLHKIIYDNTGQNYKWVHQEPIGCINDFCGWKQDAQFKFKTADVCKNCLDIIEQYFSANVLSDIIKILNEVRKNVISSSKYFDPPSFELTYFSPIALTKRKISTNSDPLRKTLFAIDHFDLLIKIHVYFSLAISSDSDSINSFLDSNELFKRPSLGNWVTALSKLTLHLKKESFALSDIKVLSNTTKKILAIAEENHIVRLRNEERGHGYINCQDAKYSTIYKQLNGLLNEIEEFILNTFANYRLVRPINCSKKDEQKYHISYNLLVGSNMLLEEKTKTLENNPDFIDNNIYLVNKDFTSWYNVSPFLILDRCPACHHKRLMVKDGEKYIDIYIGHRVQI